MTAVSLSSNALASPSAGTPHPGSQQGAAVTIDAVSKQYGSGPNALLALDQVSLSMDPGEFVCLIGASGCGKSTLLNLVAGLDQPSAGSVTVDGRTALMFQESALFPWLTVARNVDLALKLNKVPKAERKGRVADLLHAVHLDGFADKRPHELSGGMRQRVALARAFAQDADVLLMDEPFGALDAMTRDLLHEELERLWQERGFSCLFVTHNVREAARLADRVVLLSSRPGRVAETFAPELARPRRLEDPALTRLSGQITTSLRKEVARHG